MNETLPADLNAAIAMQAAWLQVWVMVLVTANSASAWRPWPYCSALSLQALLWDGYINK